MNKKEIQDALNVPDKYFEERDMNPLRLALDQEWDEPHNKDGKDYRTRAIDRCVEAKVPFTSEGNTIFNLNELFIKLVNPISGNEMQITHQSGNGVVALVTFKDMETKDIVNLTIPVDGIKFYPHKEE